MSHDQSLRYLCSVLAAPLDESGNLKKGSPHFRSLFAIGDVYYAVEQEPPVRFVMPLVATSFLAGFVLSRLWSPIAYLPCAAAQVAALVLHFLRWRKTRNALRHELPQLIDAGRALRVDEEITRIATGSSGLPRHAKYNLVIEHKGVRFGVLLTEGIRKRMREDA